jgi:6-pyruvoyltetrahydropterin/6-carboxytetrahydropterin synthase
VHTVTKSYRNLPAAHRQPKHGGHCRLIHGHNWGFDITFTCDVLDDCDFVIDVGAMRCIKEFLEDTFDHTLLLNEDDPFKPHFQETLGCATGGVSFAKIVVVPSCGMEGLAQYVAEKVAVMIGDDATKLYDRKASTGARRGLKVVGVVCWEDEKNRASFGNVV